MRVFTYRSVVVHDTEGESIYTLEPNQHASLEFIVFGTMQHIAESGSLFLTIDRVPLLFLTSTNDSDRMQFNPPLSFTDEIRVGGFGNLVTSKQVLVSFLAMVYS